MVPAAADTEEEEEEEEEQFRLREPAEEPLALFELLAPLAVPSAPQFILPPRPPTPSTPLLA